ncbi:glycosyltransferase family 4 protein [Bizionia sp.]|uniref:glycosyltransferase family 4 protein n=1 Tax=Bizionia sp. TaxID=1954480 RepID=UPI003A8D0410
MRVIEVIASLGSGGAETLVKDLSIGLKHKQAEVLVVVVDQLYNESSENYKIKQLEEQGIQVKSLNRKPGKKQFSTFLNFYNIIKEFKPSIIHFHSFIGGFYLIPFMLFFRDIKYFQTVHSTKNFLGQFNRAVQKNIFNRFCKLIYCSEAASKNLSTTYGAGITINNGVTVNNPNCVREKLIEEQQLPADAVLFINVGRIVYEKNQIFLLDLIEILNKNKYKGKLYLLICGTHNSDHIYNELMQRHQSLVFKDQIRFLGVRNDILDLMYSCDLYISTSIHEGLPITGLEAANVGVPMVLSPIPEHFNVFNNTDNVYFPIDSNLMSFYDLISSIKVDKDKEVVIQKRANFIQKYSMESNIDRHYSLFLR